MDAILGFLFCYLVYMFIFIPVPCCLIYSNFVVYFKIKQCDTSSFVLLYQGCSLSQRIFCSFIQTLEFFLVLWSFDKNCIRSVDCSECCCCSVAMLCLTLCDPVDCSTPGLPVLHHLSRSFPKFMSIVSVMPSSYLIL